ncbi:MAG: hypothetical protein AB1696_15045 [Planctomycetota bacterium]
MATSQEMIRDPRFQRGFIVCAPKEGKRVVEGALQWDAAAGEPIWDLAQWHSKHSIAGVEPERLPSGAVRYSNAAKAVVVGPPESEEADLILAVNASREYGDRARQKGEGWPHLLVSQRFETHPAIPDLKELIFHASVRLRRSEFHKTEDYTPNMHAAQFQFFITIQNLNKESSGFGDFLYFGVPFYDSRWRATRPFAAPDAWGKFIYTPAGDVYTKESTHDGQWVTIEKDLLPLIHDGLKTAWEKGSLKDSHDPADYRLGGMNVGWEVPGIFDVEMQLRDLSLRAVAR